ncbi:MAG: hypothetical protein A2289_20025 [Deltaproteobacteria bacterium RIFOXYA12_FULL_58_15]|nr:MAG: hypothetical protein A2289_20025 [Deltaproteobacteria bacterium RIFOXYA12_FULL_58_15]OGR07140.1 MAG: hypothetical protein A2341_03320 [Deltaproteobacteria bacterium RIFOXYB12_FULL_58_9]
MECLLSRKRDQFFYPTHDASSTACLLTHSIGPDHIIPFSLRRRVRSFVNDSAVIHLSNMTEQLRHFRIDSFLPAYRSSIPMELWARTHSLHLLSPSARLQRRLEDKVRFDRILRAHAVPAPQSQILATVADSNAVHRYPLVLQTAHSEGGEGTYLVRSRDELHERLANPKSTYPMLTREFICGPAFGVTLVVGDQDLLISSVRGQCIDLERRGSGLFGIQWLATGHFSPRLRASMDATFALLGRVLRAEGFRGAASIDFMVDGEQVLVIECNPRFSAATPQLSLQPSLLHGLDFATEYVRALTGARLGGDLPFVPESSYQGCCVDFGDWITPQLRAINLRRVGGMPRIGVYEMSPEAPQFAGHDTEPLRFVSENVADVSGADRLLFHYSTTTGSRIGSKSDLGSLIVNFPMFDFSNDAAHLTARGDSLLHALQRQVAGKKNLRPHLAAQATVAAVVAAAH